VRYAIYFSPAPDDPLTAAASEWLGRNAFTGKTADAPASLSLPAERWQQLVAEPRRYGFHATLKAPFELREDRTEAELVSSFDHFAASTGLLEIPRVVLGQLGPFFALVPHESHPPLQAFAASVVEAFEPFRAPLSDADVARRKPERLTEAQRAHLMTWGYPYVMDEFRFHMTLTGPVDPALAPGIDEELQRRFSSFTDMPLTLDGLALFIERSRGEPFSIHRWRPLGQPGANRKILP
jgi:putative phosphonate metabolism protein